MDRAYSLTAKHRMGCVSSSGTGRENIGGNGQVKLREAFIGKKMLRRGAALAGAVLFFLAAPVLEPAVQQILGQAALFSAALTMPQGAVEALRERFAGDLQEDEEPLPPQSSSSPSSASREESSVSSSQTEDPEPLTEDTGEDLPQKRQEEEKGPAPDIPEEHQAALVSKLMTGEEENPAFIPYGAAWVRNYTTMTGSQISQVLKTQAALEVPQEGPQVLIYHTHTTESYEGWDREIYDDRNTWRSQDNTENMAAVGEALAQALEAQGIQVIHDVEQHDYPSYNGAYDRSRETVEEYLRQYPSIVMAIDVHRDAILYEDGSVVKPVAEVAGEKAAQLMIIAPCDDDGSLGIPGWKENFRFAAQLCDRIEQRYPGLTRPIFFCYRHYNLDLTPASLLFEVGTNGNTLEEAMYTAQLIAGPLAELLQEYQGM